MRQQCKTKIDLRGTVIGGEKVCICLPMVASNMDSLLDEARELVDRSPDLLEWRVDAFSAYHDKAVCIEALGKLRDIIGQIPLIFTCRGKKEGGLQEISQDLRKEIIVEAMSTGSVDLVDVELDNDDNFLQPVINGAEESGVKLILSHHNFTQTPPESEICDVLLRAQEKGADIAKIAVMPSCYSDVLTLLSATNNSRANNIHVPMITISMGVEGGVSRLAGGLFGSDVTFAAGLESSAPGQHSITALRTAMSLLYE